MFLLFSLLYSRKATRKNRGGIHNSCIEIFTVKTGFKGICTDDFLKQTLDATTREVSMWMYETALYILYHLNELMYSGDDDAIAAEFTKKKNNEYFYKYFAALRNRVEDNFAENHKNPINDNYKELRESIGTIPYYSKLNKGNILAYASTNYETNFSTNIWRHAKSRIKAFLRALHPNDGKDDIENTVTFLFHTTTIIIPNESHMNSIDQYLVPPANYFRKIENEWYTFFPIFWRLHRFNDANQLRNFKLFPLYAYGRKYIRIDTRSLASQANVKRRGLVNRDDEKDHRIVWMPRFNYQQFETKLTNPHEGHKFDFSIVTDSVGASVQMHRKKKKTYTADEQTQRNESFRSLVEYKLKTKKYERIGGIDLGERLTIGAVIRDPNTDKDINRIKYFSKQYHHDSGLPLLKQRRLELTKTAVESKENDRKIFPLSGQNFEYDFTHSLIVELPQKAAATKAPKQTEEKIQRQSLREKRKLKRQQKRQENRYNLVPNVATGFTGEKEKKKKSRKKLASMSSSEQTDAEKREKALEREQLRQLSEKSWNFKDFVKFELAHMQRMQSCFLQEQVARLKFLQYKWKDSALHQLAKNIAESGKITRENGTLSRRTRNAPHSVDELRPADESEGFAKDPAETYAKNTVWQKKTLIFVGDCGMTVSNSPIRGYLRTPMRRFLKILRLYCDVVLVDEYLTTKTCSKCYKLVDTANSPHRYQYCTHCKSVSLIRSLFFILFHNVRVFICIYFHMFMHRYGIEI